MSGGVDSSVAAAILKNQGYEVIGVFMQFWFPQGVIYGENRCCSLESYQDARAVADVLDIKLYKLNFGNDFKKLIVDKFLSEYKNGRTPNPCVACNKFIKFDLLLKKARIMFDADYLATGHYVRVEREILNSKFEIRNKFKIQNLKFKLLRGKDINKDQSYFLYNLNQKSLKYLLFPVGDYTKDRVRELAKKYKLPVHNRPDSQEICFVGNSHYDFLKKYLKLKPGNIVDGDGNQLGKHQGLPFYTLGQRSGIGLSGGPWYVTGFNNLKNTLEVTKDQKYSGIYQRELKCHKVNWIMGEPKFPLQCQAQIRYQSKSYSCVVKKDKAGLKVEFGRPQRAIMAGQSIVFYNNNDKVLGGGIIC